MYLFCLLFWLYFQFVSDALLPTCLVIFDCVLLIVFAVFMDLC